DLGPPRGAGDPPWKFNPEVDVDMRGQSQGLLTLEKALDEAFRRTGVPREQFTPTRWAKDRFGKTHAVEWEVLEGENQGTQVNVDNPRVAPSNYGPVDPHVGYEVPGKRSRGEGKRGHIILNEVPATR